VRLLIVLFEMRLRKQDKGMKNGNAVFDLSVMRVANSQQEAPLVSKPLCMDTIPTLDSISVYTDDSASTSSISSHGTRKSNENCQRRRSIFSRYWEASQETPLELTSRITSAPPPSLEQRRVPDPPLLQKTVPPTKAEVVVKPNIPSSPGRRSIMTNGSRSHSVPSLQTAGRPKTRKIFSSLSELEENKTPTRSCLREARFSGTSRRSSSLSESSVRFDMDAIDVVHFEPPREVYSQSGWFNYFA
jgi:hypothetical protein